MPRVTPVARTLLLLAYAVSGLTVSAQFSGVTAVHATGNLFGAYAGWTNQLLWEPGSAGVGAGLTAYVGTTQLDAHLVPHLRLSVGWFYLQGGWNFTLRDASGDAQPFYDGVHGAVGIAPRFLPLGIGRLGIDLGFEYLYRIPETAAPPARSLLAQWGIGGWPADLLYYPLAFGAVKFGAFYSFPFN